ncbi:hypothetical protein HDV62DRAFT_345467 [Trichoderma sp. SZMC 28011]
MLYLLLWLRFSSIRYYRYIPLVSSIITSHLGDFKFDTRDAGSYFPLLNIVWCWLVEINIGRWCLIKKLYHVLLLLRRCQALRSRMIHIVHVASRELGMITSESLIPSIITLLTLPFFYSGYLMLSLFLLWLSIRPTTECSTMTTRSRCIYETARRTQAQRRQCQNLPGSPCAATRISILGIS